MPIYTTYDTVGIKEDVSDIISNISPTKTPFQTMIGSDKTRNRVFSWLEDSLRAVQANAQVEGFTPSADTLTPPVSRNNVTQILEKTFSVSDTEDAVDQYGRAKETAYQTALAMEEVKRDLENAFVGVNQAAVQGSTTVARQMASALAQFDASVTITNAPAASLTEAMILTASQDAYNQGGDPTTLMIKPSDSLIVAGFTGAAGRYRTFDGANDKKVTNVVNLYVSPFGELKVVLNRFINPAYAVLLDPAMWSQVTLRPWQKTVLAKSGDNTTIMIVGEFSLKHKNYKAGALIGGLL